MDLSENLIVSFIARDLLSGVASAVGDAFENLVGRMRAGSTGIAKGLQDAGVAMVGVGAAFLVASAGLVVGMVQAARAAADYESQLVLLHTHAGMSVQDINQVREALIEMAPAVGFGPTELAKAFYLVQSATSSLPERLQDVASKEDILAQSAKLAQIGHADLSATTNVMVDVLDVYGKANYTAAQAAAILNATVGEGKMRLADLTQAFAGGLLPVAEQAGIKLESLGAAIATMTDAGIPASRAATYLRSAIIQMTEPTGPAVKALEAIGVSTSETAGRMGGFSDVLRRAGITQTEVAQQLSKTGSLADTLTFLKQKLDAAGLSGQEAGALIGKAFGGIRSGTGIETLSNLLGPLTQKEKDLTKATSDWSDTWSYFQKNDPNFALMQIHATLQSLEVALGEAFLPALRDVLAVIAPIASRVLGWVSAHRELTAHIIEGTAALLAILGVMFIVGGAVSFVTGTLIRFGGPVVSLIGWLSGLTGAVRMGAGVLGGFGAALITPLRYLAAFGLEAFRLIPGLSSLWGALRFGVGLFSEFGLSAFRLLPGIGGLISLIGGLGGRIASLAGLGIDFVKIFGFRSIIPALLTALRGLGPAILSFLTGLGPLIAGGLRAAFVAGIPAVLGALSSLAAFILPIIIIAGVLAAVAVLVYMNWSRISGAVQTVAAAFGAAVTMFQQTHSVGMAIVAFLDRLGMAANTVGSIMSVLHGIWSAVTSVFQSGVGILQHAWQTLIQGMAHIQGMQQMLHSLGQAWHALQPIILVVGIVLGIIGGIILALLGGAFQGLVQFLAIAIPAAIQIAIGLITAMGGVIEVMSSIIVGVVTIVVDLLSGNWAGAWQAAQTMVKGVAEGISNIVRGLWLAINTLFTQGTAAVLALVTGFVSGFIGAAENLYHMIVGGSIIPDLVNGIVSWIAQLPGRVGAQAAAMVSSFISQAESMASRAGSAAQNAVNNIINTLWGAVGRAADVGANIARGLANGIWGAIGSIAAAAAGMVHSAISAAQAAGLMASPSRVAERMVGMPLSEGVAVGIQRSAGLPQAAITRVVQGAVQAGQTAASSTPIAIRPVAPQQPYQSNPEAQRTNQLLQQMQQLLQQVNTHLVTIAHDQPSAAAIAQRIG